MTTTDTLAPSIAARIASFIASCAVTLVLVTGAGTMQLPTVADQAVSSRAAPAARA